MGCDTKGVVITSTKDVFLVCTLVESAINKLIKDHIKIEFPEKGHLFSSKIAERFVLLKMEMSPRTKMVQAYFTFKGEKRQLSLCFGCDCDHTELAPQSLSLSLGAWGESALIMRTVLYVLGLLGESYFDEIDSDSVDLAPQPHRLTSVLEAVARGYITPYDFENLVDYFDAGQFSTKASFQELFGCSRNQYELLAAKSDNQQRWKQLTALAAELELPVIPFSTESGPHEKG